jgi:hypothetical protein
MPTAQFGISFTAAGVSSQKTVERTADSAFGVEATLGVTSALSSWVKTDADTAAGNLSGGHGLTDGTYDVYWTGGRRYGVAITITTNAVALEGGAGTDFPASATSTVVMRKQQVVNVGIDGDALGAMCLVLEATAGSTARGHATFKDSASDVIAQIDLVANVPQCFDVEGGQTNPFTGDPIVTVHATQESSSATATLKIMGVADSTP